MGMVLPAIVLTLLTLARIHVQSSDAIDLFSKDNRYTGFVYKPTRAMVITSEFPENWQKSVEDCERVNAGILQILTRGVLNYIIDRRSVQNKYRRYFIDGKKCPGQNTWVSTNGTRIVFDNSLLVEDTQNMDQNNECYCLLLHETKLITKQCSLSKYFMCQREILSFLRLPQVRGAVELRHSSSWGRLCFDLDLTAHETKEICKNQYNDLYANYSNDYVYPSIGNDDYWYDNPNLRCHQTELHCEGDPPGRPEIEASTDAMHAGDVITLSCVVEGGIPKPTLVWDTGGRAVTARHTWELSDENVVIFNSSISLTLTPNDDKAVLTCVVHYNGSVNYHRKDFMLLVMYPPIVTVSADVEVHETNAVIMQCNVTSNPSATVSWSGPIGRSNETNLHVTGIYRTAHGSYTCRAENSLGGQENRTYIYVNAASKLCLLQYEFTDENQTVSMTCSITGIPAPTVTWYRQAEPLIPNTRNHTSEGGAYSSNHTIEGGPTATNPYLVSSTLTVSDVGEENEEEYRCTATNANGVIQKTFRIRRKLKCRCRSRLLKNCVPLVYEPGELKEIVAETKENLTMEKTKLTGSIAKLVSRNDERSSSFIMGALGAGILATVGCILIVFDLVAHFVVNPQLKKE
ncbi:uncharacterized protein [Argopecten irradians]|uniref:uncharacterized protein n=1 Tax=Argopecten irradians TaxID=31199 RepID=UPI00372389A5